MDTGMQAVNGCLDGSLELIWCWQVVWIVEAVIRDREYAIFCLRDDVGRTVLALLDFPQALDGFGVEVYGEPCRHPFSEWCGEPGLRGSLFFVQEFVEAIADVLVCLSVHVEDSGEFCLVDSRCFCSCAVRACVAEAGGVLFS